MKFSCEKALLQSAINTASRAVSAKSSIPALEGLLLQADSALTISGYNMQTGIRTTVEADVTHFCRMFDYRNKDGDWGNSRDAIERAIAYLTGRLYTGREDGEDKA